MVSTLMPHSDTTTGAKRPRRIREGHKFTLSPEGYAGLLRVASEKGLKPSQEIDMHYRQAARDLPPLPVASPEPAPSRVPLLMAMRKAAGLSRRTIAERLVVEEGEIRNQENGHRGEPDDARLAKWKEACSR